jgi:hypothetical protein
VEKYGKKIAGILFDKIFNFPKENLRKNKYYYFKEEKNKKLGKLSNF